MSNPNRAEPLDGNPFDDTSDVNPFGTHANASSFSLEDQTTPNASKYSFGGNPAAETTTYSAREEELRRKDEEIRRREEELNMRERNLDRTEAKANWPPFFPLIRHQLSDLPDANQRTMKALYIQWLALIATLIVNLVACILLLLAGSSDGGKDTAASGSYIPVITLTSFFLWYRPIYLGYAKDNGLALFFCRFSSLAPFTWNDVKIASLTMSSSGRRLLLFRGMASSVFALTYILIGPSTSTATGSAGLINTISMLSQGHIAAGVLGVISSVGWAFQTFAGGWLYKTVWDFKNNHEGLNFANATDQFKRESFKTVVMHQSRM
ncbi:hypothetical protein QFC22_000497 [Naganishia vaughanmartiniae]|uniref:Uncharacterized protein n=1 Tax=Naganishia vaughanmartiniae TaxID=1424756 RepID=A0ACC2XQ90_9TREE|nr:hypothetical protein QFC22_000497 [Naganishia vaughanmartiniae]